MERDRASFKFSSGTLKKMDRLITNPPAIAIDPERGPARSRTELIEVLVAKAVEKQARETKKAR